jgi:VWFA-related protein
MSRKLWGNLVFRAAAIAVAGLLTCKTPGILAQSQDNANKAPAAQPAPQANPPAAPQPTAPNPDSDDDMSVFKLTSTTRYVTTPVTVTDTSGQFVYDLEKDEFKVYDNGELQDIKQLDSDLHRIALVIVVETNDTTAPFMDSVRNLGSIFSQAVMGPQGEVAVLTYSDHVAEPLDFSSDSDKLDSTLRGLSARGSGMHLDDAILRALSMLENRSIDPAHRDDRKVVVIFSDGFNIGSKMRRSEIVQRAMNSNITLYGLGFSPVTGIWKRPVSDPKPDLVAESIGRPLGPNQVPTPTAEENTWDTGDAPIASILLGLGEEAKKPVFKSSLQYFSRYSGGTYYQKWGKDTVQTALNHIATEIHSQYELAYAPSNATQPGFHKIEVQVRRPGTKVRARSGWFYQGEPERGVVVK